MNFLRFAAFVFAAIAATSAVAGPVGDRIQTTTLTLPVGLQGAQDSFCIGGNCSLGPRLYLAPRALQAHRQGQCGGLDAVADGTRNGARGRDRGEDERREA